MTETARLYGQTLYDLARDEGLSDQILEELEALETVFHAEPVFLRLLDAPAISKQERCRILSRSLSGQVHPYVEHFLKILTRRGHIRRFSGCCQAFRQAYNRDHGILPVQIVTAAPLSGELRSRLTAKLCRITGKTVSLSCRTDPGCLGGIRVEFDGRQLDGTLRRRLDDLRGILTTPPL